MKFVVYSCRFTVGLFLLSQLAFGHAQAEERSSSDLNVGQAKSGQKYAIQFVPAKKTFRFTERLGTFIGGAPSNADFKAVSDLLQQETALYPRRLVEETGLRRIVLCDCLTINGWALVGFAYPERREIFIDVTAARRDEQRARALIHHEFFHLIDEKLQPSLRSPNWVSLNQPTFRYRCRAAGGYGARDDTDRDMLSEKYPGFLNSYSTSDECEDRAEVFAHLIVHSSYLSRRMAEDRVLRTKVAWIKDVLAKWCPEAGGGFWEEAQKLERPPQRRPALSKEEPPRHRVEPGEAKGPGN